MTEGHDNPILTIVISMGLGVASWIADPNVYRALAVAAACGFIGGVGKAAGLWAWNKARDRRKRKQG